MNSSNFAVAIDIGSSKVCGVVGSLDTNGQDINIEAFAERSFSINDTATQSGKIINLEQTARLIDVVLSELAQQTNEPIDQFSVAISGNDIEGNVFKTTITRSEANTTVQDEDLMSLLNDVRRSFKPRAGHLLLHTLPQFFNVDDRTVSGDPVGNIGVRLGGAFYAITTPKEQLQHIYECVSMIPAKTAEGADARHFVELENVLFTPIPDSISLLNLRDKDGVAVVNIGSDVTELSVFIRSGIRYTNVIPVAGKNITQDIADAYNLSMEDAEILKLTCSAIPQNHIERNDVMVIEHGDEMPNSEIPSYGVVEIIEARIREIAAIVTSELMKHDFHKKLNKGIIITGGGANILLVKDVFSEITDLHTRIGNPLKNIKRNAISILQNPKYSTVVGLMLSSFIDFDNRVPRSILEPNAGEMIKEWTSHSVTQQTGSKKQPEPTNLINDFVSKIKRILKDDSHDSDTY